MLALAVGVTAFVALVSSTRPAINDAVGSGSCSAPQLGGVKVDVTLSDAGDAMMSHEPMMATLTIDPTSVAAGRVSFVALNNGALVHEMVVLPLPSHGPGTRLTGSDGKINETQSLGEASRSCAAGAGDGIAPGNIGWTTMTLKPGRYELVCDEPWHYGAGMFEVLTVQ
jgi:uncharacterized cupredoxin-like copper-binding protein